MTYNLFLQPEATLEIEDAFNWYEDQKDGLGYEFLETLQFSYEKLVEQPDRYGYINPVYRRIKTNKFPYILVYKIEGNNIVIVSVRHTKRKPF